MHKNFSRADTDDVTMRVIKRLTETLGRDETDMEPLASSIDLEALDTFVESAPDGTVVSFTHIGCRVQLRKDGSRVTVGVSRDTHLMN